MMCIYIYKSSWNLKCIHITFQNLQCIYIVFQTYSHFTDDVSTDPYPTTMDDYGWYKNSEWWIVVAFSGTIW